MDKRNQDGLRERVKLYAQICALQEQLELECESLDEVMTCTIERMERLKLEKGPIALEVGKCYQQLQGTTTYFEQELAIIREELQEFLACRWRGSRGRRS